MKNVLPILFFLYTLSGYSQTNSLTLADFNLTGDAIAANDNCYQLTPATDWRGGAVWYKELVDLNDPFEMELKLEFGCDDSGADGIVFIFYPQTKTGRQGEGMGFAGLKPSIGIEMDTYQNFHLSDPAYDHVALIKNGRPGHKGGISEPVPLIRDKKNVEDCQAHKAKVQWSPSTKILNFFFDGDPRISFRIDLVADVFNNDPLVYWGFTAATGGEHNRHLVCIEKTQFTDSESFDLLTKKELLASKRRALETVVFENGQTNLPEVEIKELNKYIKLLKENEDYTLHIEAHTDNSGSVKQNKILSKKRAEAIRDYILEKGIAPERIKSFGYGPDHPKAPHDTPEGRAINRRVEMSLHLNRA